MGVRVFYCMFADRIHSLQEEKAVYRVCLFTWGRGVWSRWEGGSDVTGHIRPPPLPHGHLGIIPSTAPQEPSLQTMSYPTTRGPTATFLETASWSSTERLLELVLELWVVNTSHEQHRFGDVASDEETEWSIQHQGDLWWWYFRTSHYNVANSSGSCFYSVLVHGDVRGVLNVIHVVTKVTKERRLVLFPATALLAWILILCLVHWFISAFWVKVIFKVILKVIL